eukprot:89232-Heterocapsa_arctica.AAC.1
MEIGGQNQMTPLMAHHSPVHLSSPLCLSSFGFRLGFCSVLFLLAELGRLVIEVRIVTVSSTLGTALSCEKRSAPVQ